MVAVGDEQVCAPQSVIVPNDDGWIGVGTGWGTYESELRDRVGTSMTSNDSEVFPHALDVAWLGRRVIDAGEGVEAALAVPVYLRDNVAAKPKPR